MKVRRLGEGGGALGPLFFEAVQGGAGGFEEFGGGGRVGAGFFFQLEHDGEVVPRSGGFEQLYGGGPVDGAGVGREMLIFVAVIVVEMDAGDEITHRLETFFDAFFFRAVNEVGVAHIEIETQAGEASFVDQKERR